MGRVSKPFDMDSYDMDSYDEGEALFTGGYSVADIINLAELAVERGNANLGKDGSDEQLTAWAEEAARGERQAHGIALGYINGIIKKIRSLP
jgi:hypothetical protein